MIPRQIAAPAGCRSFIYPVLPGKGCAKADATRSTRASPKPVWTTSGSDGSGNEVIAEFGDANPIEFIPNLFDNRFEVELNFSVADHATAAT